MNRAPHRVALAVVAAVCPGVAAASALEEVMVTARKVAEAAADYASLTPDQTAKPLRKLESA